MKKILYLIVSLFSIGLFLSSICPYVNSENIPLLNIFSVLHPWLFVFTFIFLLILIILESKKLFIPIVAIIFAITSVPRFISFSKKNTADLECNIFSYNVGNLAYWDDNTVPRKNRAKKLIEAIDKSKYDVIAFQEVSEQTKQKLKNIAQYHHFIKGRGTMILSPHKIIDQGEIAFTNKVNSCLWVDLLVDGQKIRFYNMHLLSSRISRDADKLISGEISDNSVALRNGASILKRFVSTSKMRAKEAQKLRKHFESCPHPYVIIGDFNETPQSWVYQHIKSNHQDSFSKKGNGLGVSYRGKIPWLRIDHIFIPSEYDVLRHKLLNWPYSDHKALETSFDISPRED